MVSAAARASDTVRSTPVPGITGRPAADMVSFSRALSPSRSILSGEGPMNTRPFFRHRSAKPGFSERKPYPG